MKIQLHQPLTQLDLLRCTAAWFISQADETVLRVFENKMLRKIYDHLTHYGKYSGRMILVLYELYPGIDVVQRKTTATALTGQ